MASPNGPDIPRTFSWFEEAICERECDKAGESQDKDWKELALVVPIAVSTISDPYLESVEVGSMRTNSSSNFISAGSKNSPVHRSCSL